MTHYPPHERWAEMLRQLGIVCADVQRAYSQFQQTLFWEYAGSPLEKDSAESVVSRLDGALRSLDRLQNLFKFMESEMDDYEDHPILKSEVLKKIFNQFVVRRLVDEKVTASLLVVLHASGERGGFRGAIRHFVNLRKSIAEDIRRLWTLAGAMANDAETRSVEEALIRQGENLRTGFANLFLSVSFFQQNMVAMDILFGGLPRLDALKAGREPAAVYAEHDRGTA